MKFTRYPITPVAAPRQLRKTRFSKKDGARVLRYHAFCDEVKIRGVVVPERCFLRFEMPVPKGGQDRIGKPHQQRPDLDNLIKGLLDAVFDEDAHVYEIHAEKVWEDEGAILVGEL